MTILPLPSTQFQASLSISDATHTPSNDNGVVGACSIGSKSALVRQARLIRDHMCHPTRIIVAYKSEAVPGTTLASKREAGLSD